MWLSDLCRARATSMIAIDARMFCHPIYTGIGQVAVRPIVAGDTDMLQAFVRNLSGSSRYFRFLQPLQRLSPSMLDRLTCIDCRTHVALVAVTSINGEKRIIGEARYAITDDGVTAEIALVVADEWQRRGVGTGLLRILERIAAANGIARLTGEGFASNDKFHCFAQASGFEALPNQDPAYSRLEKDIGGMGTLLSKSCGFARW
jgi:acetyltransferase